MVPEPADQVEEADGRQTEAGAAAGAPSARPLLRGGRNGVLASASPAAATPDIRGDYIAPSHKIFIYNISPRLHDTGRGGKTGGHLQPGAIAMLGNRGPCKRVSCRTSNLILFDSAPK